MNITQDLEHFVEGHQSHGSLTSDTGALTPNAYRLTVACCCGVTFERWITPEEAARDLVVLTRPKLRVGRGVRILDAKIGLRLPHGRGSASCRWTGWHGLQSQRECPMPDQ